MHEGDGKSIRNHCQYVPHTCDDVLKHRNAWRIFEFYNQLQTSIPSGTGSVVHKHNHMKCLQREMLEIGIGIGFRFACRSWEIAVISNFLTTGSDAGYPLNFIELADNKSHIIFGWRMWCFQLCYWWIIVFSVQSFFSNLSFQELCDSFCKATLSNHENNFFMFLRKILPVFI